MKRTVLLVVSVLVAAIGTAVVALWATGEAAKQPVKVIRAPAAAASTPAAVPTGPLPGHVSTTMAVSQVGVVAGQKVDLILTGEGGGSGLFLADVPVLAVQPDGRLTLSMDEQDLIRLNTAMSRGAGAQAVVAGDRSSVASSVSRWPTR